MKDKVDATITALNSDLITLIQARNMFNQLSKLEGFEKDKQDHDKKVS